MPGEEYEAVNALPPLDEVLEQLPAADEPANSAEPGTGQQPVPAPGYPPPESSEQPPDAPPEEPAPPPGAG